MTRIKIHISNVKLPFYPPYEVKCELQNRVSIILFIFQAVHILINYVIVRYIFLISFSCTTKLFEFQICYSKFFILLKRDYYIYNFSHRSSSFKLLIEFYLLIQIHEIGIAYFLGIPKRLYHIINLIFKIICRKKSRFYV